MIHVVAAAVTDSDGRVLIAQRPPGKHLAGGWEFPGGKLEPGESRATGLARELNEELGISIRNPRPLIRVRHTYPYGEVLIDMWVVRSYSGEPRGLDGQALKWLTQAELETAELLPADRPIVRVLRLPERLTQLVTRDYTISELGSMAPTAHNANCAVDGRLHGLRCTDAGEAAAAAGNGSDFLVLCRPLVDGTLAKLCDSVSVPVFAREFRLEHAWALGASGCNEITQ